MMIAYLVINRVPYQTAAYRANLSPLPELSLLDLPDPDRKPSYSREQLQPYQRC